MAKEGRRPNEMPGTSTFRAANLRRNNSRKSRQSRNLRQTGFRIDFSDLLTPTNHLDQVRLPLHPSPHVAIGFNLPNLPFNYIPPTASTGTITTTATLLSHPPVGTPYFYPLDHHAAATADFDEYIGCPVEPGPEPTSADNPIVISSDEETENITAPPVIARDKSPVVPGKTIDNPINLDDDDEEVQEAVQEENRAQNILQATENYSNNNNNHYNHHGEDIKMRSASPPGATKAVPLAFPPHTDSYKAAETLVSVQPVPVPLAPVLTTPIQPASLQTVTVGPALKPACKPSPVQPVSARPAPKPSRIQPASSQPASPKPARKPAHRPSPVQPSPAEPVPVGLALKPSPEPSPAQPVSVGPAFKPAPKPSPVQSVSVKAVSVGPAFKQASEPSPVQPVSVKPELNPAPVQPGPVKAAPAQPASVESVPVAQTIMTEKEKEREEKESSDMQIDSEDKEKEPIDTHMRLEHERTPEYLPSGGVEEKEEEIVQEDGMEDNETKMDYIPDNASETSVSSSELIFGAAPVSPVADSFVVSSLIEPNEMDRAPDWRYLTNLSSDDRNNQQGMDIDDLRHLSNLSLEDQQSAERMEIDHPRSASPVKTKIPKDQNLIELVSQIDLYIESVKAPLEAVKAAEGNKDKNGRSIDEQSIQPQLGGLRRKTRSSSKRKTMEAAATAATAGKESGIIYRPYIPSRLWRQATWEDWAQFEVGDWLHWPFEEWEVKVIQKTVDRYDIKAKKRKADGIAIFGETMWEVIANLLPGRRPIDCSRYWNDRKMGIVEPYARPVIIAQDQQTPRRESLYDFVSQARYFGKRRMTASISAVWRHFKRERTFGDGSADTLALQIITGGREKGLKIVAGSACNDQPEYNMPGNLRLWNADTDSIFQMRGHKTSLSLPDGTEQDIWSTVTDVKLSNDQRFIFSSSHDKTARVWSAKNGRMLSTLCYHEKAVHQIAVRPGETEHIIATGSSDGTAVIWQLKSTGNVGTGIVCEVDAEKYRSPSVDCLAFGHGRSHNTLFTGIVNEQLEQPGLIQCFDIETAKVLMSFTSMKGGVCDLDISTTGQYVISGNHSPLDDHSGDGFIHIHDVRTPSAVIKAYTGHEDVNVVRMSPCEIYVACGNPFNETAVVDIRNPKAPLFRLHHKRNLADHLVPINSDMGISGIYWMSNRRTLITSGGDCSVKLWDVWGSGELLHSYPTSGNVTSLAVDEDNMILCAGVSGAQGIVHVWTPS